MTKQRILFNMDNIKKEIDSLRLSIDVLRDKINNIPKDGLEGNIWYDVVSALRSLDHAKIEIENVDYRIKYVFAKIKDLNN